MALISLPLFHECEIDREKIWSESLQGIKRDFRSRNSINMAQNKNVCCLKTLFLARIVEENSLSSQKINKLFTC